MQLIPSRLSNRISAVTFCCALAACGEVAKLPISAGIGPNPVLPAPKETLLPTVNIAEAKGWPAGMTPIPTAGTKVNAFATGLNHPRWLYVLPNGDVLVAETNAPAKNNHPFSIRGWIAGWFMKKAGAGVPSANRIMLLRDTNKDGIADIKTVFLQGLHSPFGMALIGNDFFVANTDAVMKFSYQAGSNNIQSPGVNIINLPAGPNNYHWTKNLIASEDGKKLYVTTGSNSNVAEYGMAEETGRAAIWEINLASGSHRIFASGLRNPNGLAWDRSSGKLYTVVNERDEIGSDLVPDYITSVQENGFYGWPYSYYGKHIDTRVSPTDDTLVNKAIVPDYALGSHAASLGLAAAEGTSLPAQFAHGMFIGQHGSWNRNPPSGYKVIFIALKDGKLRGEPLDVLTGFLNKKGEAYGRPVGVALDSTGALLVADDVGNTIWRVSNAMH